MGLQDCDPFQSLRMRFMQFLGRTIPGHKDLLQNIYFDYEEYCIEPASIRTRSVNGSHEMTVKIREPDERGLSQTARVEFSDRSPET